MIKLFFGLSSRAFSLEFELSIVVTFEALSSRHTLLYDPDSTKMTVLIFLSVLEQKQSFMHLGRLLGLHQLLFRCEYIECLSCNT